MSSDMRVDDALDIIAKRCIANLVEHDKGGNGSTQWEDWPEIGEQDWFRVLERMNELVPDDPRGDKVKQAYATLAARAVRECRLSGPVCTQAAHSTASRHGS